MTVEPEHLQYLVKVRWSEKITYEHTFTVTSDRVREYLGDTADPEDEVTLDDIMDYLNDEEVFAETLAYREVDDDFDIHSSEITETKVLPQAPPPPPDPNQYALSIDQETP